ncbi:hypothetical protein [Streptosporangium fragile]
MRAYVPGATAAAPRHAEPAAGGLPLLAAVPGISAAGAGGQAVRGDGGYG